MPGRISLVRLRDVHPSLSSVIVSSMILFAAGTVGAKAADLSQDDLATISTSVQSALAAAASGGSAATAEALKTATLTLLSQYPQNGPEVAAAIIADALADGASPQAVGQGLGEAALGAGAPGSNEIADAIGGDGDSETLAAFDTTVSGAPGGSALAAEADAAAQKRVPSAFGGVTIGGSVGVTGAGGNACLTPSCT